MRVKRLLCSLLALCMVLSTMGTVAFANNAEADVWDGTVDTSWYNGTDTEFELTTAEQLAGLAELVNGGNTFEGKTINLGSDLDLSNEVWIPIGTSIYDKTPTDANVKMFAGNFDGGNHIITGLTSEGYVPESSETTSTEYSFGLFGYVHGANISNVKLAGVHINCGTREDSDGNNVGGSGVAALIGYYYVADGKACIIENCHVLDGTVSASNNMGGLIGFMDSQVSTPQNVNITIKNCSNSSNVTSEAREAGGILGLLNASREDYSPTMAGSITFKGCINTGDITTLDGGGSTCAGGILGKDQNEYSNQQLKIIFDECENSGTITVHASGETHVAGLGTSFYSSGTWLVAKNSSNTGNIVVVNPETCGSAPLCAGGLFAYAGVMDIIDSASTGTVIVGAEAGNTYVGDVSHILFLEGIDDFEDNINCYTYYLNGGTSPEFAALVDDVANWGGNFNVLVKTAYMTGANFQGWYDNAELTGTAYNALDTNVKTYYAKWSKYAAKIGDVCYTTLQEAVSNAVENDTIYLFGTINEGAIKLPATIRNLTIDGQESAVVKDTTINAADGNYVDVQGLTIKNTTFDNSRFVLGGQRANNVIYKDLVFDNNKFVNIVNTTSMAAVHMNLASEDNEYIENFTFTNNVINGVTGSNNSGVLLKSITGDIVFEGNTVSKVAWNALQIATAKADAKLVVENNSFASSGSSVLNIAAAPSAILENNTVVNDSGRIGLWYPAEAKIGDVLYIDIQTAINNAKDGDTITILAGEYEGFDIPATKNNLTFVGETGSTGLSRSVENLVTIKTLDTGIESHNGGIFVGAENTTFKNLNFTAGTTPGARSGWMSSSLGNTNGDTGMSSSLKNLTVENCNFTGSGAYQAIWTNQGNITLKNTTITNYNNGVDNYAIGADQKVVIENSEITDVYNAFHTGEAADGAKIVVTETDIDSEVINVGGAVAVTIEESTIKNAAVTTYASSTFAVSESALYDTIYAVDENATGSITLDAVYANNVNELATNAKADNIAFNTYYPEAKDLGTGNTVAVPAATDAIYVKFENVTDADAEGEMTYNINLVATDTEIINRLNSADLTFAFDATEGDVAYEIIASNSEVAVNPVDNSKVRYEFHYNGKDGVITDSANKITIGQVKFTGYGEFSFAVDTNATTNTAHATTVADNIVDTFIPNGDAATVANGELVIDDTTITDVVIAVPDRNLTITVDFPNAIVDNVIAYQDMKVVISGGDLDEDITIDLGTDAVATDLDIFGKADAAFVAAMDNGSYVINVTDALTVNNAYTVTVSGAGYRTARYTVTMTTDKTLRFWNNVMDENQVVELGKDSSIAKVTFLAGDIVKDNNINIYDLSAVVSYFGSVSTTENGYAKYDLNRDGVIDSKDVAYVLVSWNN